MYSYNNQQNSPLAYPYVNQQNSPIANLNGKQQNSPVGYAYVNQANNAIAYPYGNRQNRFAAHPYGNRQNRLVANANGNRQNRPVVRPRRLQSLHTIPTQTGTPRSTFPELVGHPPRVAATYISARGYHPFVMTADEPITADIRMDRVRIIVDPTRQFVIKPPSCRLDEPIIGFFLKSVSFIHLSIIHEGNMCSTAYELI
ncbi:hypothetical protein I4U23_020939 [Adineta vaga]|nr:hypothetical protein I4U23_020939 [Adineta vaga]